MTPLNFVRYYKYADLTLSSTLPLPELQSVTKSHALKAEFAFDLLPSPLELSACHWIHCWQSDAGSPTLLMAKTEGGFLLRFPDLADFTIYNNGRQISAWPLQNANHETLRHLLLDQVLPRVIAQQGHLTIHAGAVQLEEGAIAFVGDTGAGKSTLVSSLHTAGFPLLSDDSLILTASMDCTLALPTYPGLRLWPDAIAGLFEKTPDLSPMAHYSTKQRVVTSHNEGNTGQSMPLSAIYILAPGSHADPTSDKNITIKRMLPADACMAIIGNAFQLDVTDHRRAAFLLDAASCVAQQVPVFSLVYPRDFAILPEVHKKLTQHQHQHHAAGKRRQAPGMHPPV